MNGPHTHHYTSSPHANAYIQYRMVALCMVIVFMMLYDWYARLVRDEYIIIIIIIADEICITTNSSSRQALPLNRIKLFQQTEKATGRGPRSKDVN